MGPMRHVNDPAVIDRLMETPGTWAIVGLTRNEWRAAYSVALTVRDAMGKPHHPREPPRRERAR